MGLTGSAGAPASRVLECWEVPFGPPRPRSWRHDFEEEDENEDEEDSDVIFHHSTTPSLHPHHHSITPPLQESVIPAPVPRGSGWLPGRRPVPNESRPCRSERNSA